MPKSFSSKQSNTQKPSSGVKKSGKGSGQRPLSKTSSKIKSPSATKAGGSAGKKMSTKIRSIATTKKEVKAPKTKQGTASTKRTQTAGVKNSKIGTNVKARKTSLGSSPMSASTALTKSPGSSISSPHTYASGASVGSNVRKASAAIKNLAIDLGGDNNKSESPADESDIILPPTLGCWINPHQLLDWVLEDRDDVDVQDWLSSDFEYQIKDAMSCFTPKTLLAVYVRLATLLKLDPDIDAFESSRSKGEKTLLKLIIDNYLELEEIYGE